MSSRPDRGHRVVDHTADQILQAWGPTRAACLREAALGLVALFARPPPAERGPGAGRVAEVVLPAADDAELLLGLLGEVLFRVDAESAVPAEVRVTDDGGTVTARLTLVDLAEVTETGPAPKGISHSGLRLGAEGSRWVARALIDI